VSEDTERIKRLIAFREKLARRVEKLEAALKDAQAMLEAVNSVLLDKGFKRAEISKEPVDLKLPPAKEEFPVEADSVTLEPSTLPENVIPLKTASGELLAILHVTENSLHALPAEDRNFNINTPPFSQFLIERVLIRMQERDNELARAGQLPPEKIFSYNIVREGDIIRELFVKNVDSERLRELKSSIRWTLEKMYEKTKTQG
jgi:hypothetical protein